MIGDVLALEIVNRALQFNADAGRSVRTVLRARYSPGPYRTVSTAYRLARLDLMLRALDLRDEGATYREIATALGRDDAARLSASDWKMSASRSFVVRLVRDGIAMMNGDYRKLLRIR